MTIYRPGGVDNSMGQKRNISVLCDSEIFAAIDRLARRKNCSKTDLLRPLIMKLVEKRKRKQNGGVMSGLNLRADRPFAPPLTSSVVVELPGEPRAKGRPRFGNGRTYTPQATRNYESDLGFMAKLAMKGRPVMEGPLRVEIQALFSVPKSWSKIKQARALIGTIRPTGRPDFDNLGKIACDPLNGIVWRDDSQVVTATIIKKYSDRPRLRIEVEAMIGEGA